MLCCVGLVGGFAVGQYLGGPWTVIAPAAGFGIGLVADMKLMRGMHKDAGPRQRANPEEHVHDHACCGVSTGQGSRCAWLIGGTVLLGLAAYAAWDWLEASGLAPLVVLLVLVPLVLMCMRGHGTQGKAKGGMSLADIRRTYETDSGQPPRPG